MTPALHRFALRLPAETAHDLTLGALAASQRIPGALAWLRRKYQLCGRESSYAESGLGQDLLGLRFGNPLGLAAGLDKNAKVVPGMTALGFGSIEVGTVTPIPQSGNPKPRLYRHLEARSLENSLGFNNSGVEVLARRLRRGYRKNQKNQKNRPVPVGVNLGKNKKTPNHSAVEDYSRLVETLDGLCDYFVINISSPNTPGLRDLQSRQAVSQILAACRGRTQRPIMVKLSPDLEHRELVRLAESAVDAGAEGVILTNTTTDYSLLPECHKKGGLSGQVLRERSLAALRAVAPSLFGRAVLVSVGGVDSGAEAYRRLRAGASLIQLYSALVFGGPGLVRDILSELIELLRADGVESVAEVVGSEIKA